jgi:predicted nucleic acid-binding protein
VIDVPGAVLDTNVLIPAALRDVLLWTAEDGLYRPYWSVEILDELRRNLGSVGKIPEEKVGRVLAQMQSAFPGAMIPAWPPERVDTLANVPKDRHVLAVAIEARARYIVTENLSDFRPQALAPHGIEAVSADAFLIHLLKTRRRRLLNVLRTMAERLSRPSCTSLDIAVALARQTPAFSERVKSEMAKLKC